MKIRKSTLLFVVLLLIHAMLLAWSAGAHSPTIDEIEWLPCGLLNLMGGRGDLVTRNPPHVGSIAAVPLLFANPRLEALESSDDSRSIGSEFIRSNGSRSFWLFTLGRWACIPFSILGAITCFVWARTLYGVKPGLLAATLWCFCPNVLAHGQLVSHDVPATSMALVATYAFWRWLRCPSFSKALLAGLLLGLALLTKMTILLVLALWPLIWLGWSLTAGPTQQSLRNWTMQGAQVCLIIILALDVLNLGYLGRGSFDRLDSYSFRSRALGGQGGNRFSESLLGGIRVPLPRSYLEGLDFQRFALEGGMTIQSSYLRGEWSRAGWWYYYLYALAIKVPLGTSLLMLLSIVYRFTDQLRCARDEFVLLVPAAAILFVASTSTVTDHLRYVLPCFPFAFIWGSRIANVTWRKHRCLYGLELAAIAWLLVSSLSIYPHSLSYFNELIGGPLNGHYHLLSSNIDYGQDLLKLKSWYDRHPEARPLGLGYFDLESVDPHIAGIEYFVAPSGKALPPTMVDLGSKQLGPKPGWYAINVNALHADDSPARQHYPSLPYYGYFLRFEPVARAGYSIYIYHVSLDDANRVRVQLGLPSI